MKVELSAYLKECKPKLKSLVDKLSSHFDFVSILGTDTRSSCFDVRTKLTTLRDGGHTERGFVARVFKDGKYFEYSFDALGELDEIAKRIVDYATRSSECKHFSYPLLQEQEAEKSFAGNVAVGLNQLGAEQKVARLRSIVQKAMAASDKLVEFVAIMSNCHISKIYVSTKRDLQQSYIWSEAYLVAIVREGQVTRDGFAGFSGLKGLEILDEMEAEIETPIRRAENLLNAKPIKPGVYDIIFGPSAAGMIAHEAFGHGVETDMFVKQRAKGQEFIGKRVASDKVTMRDGSQSTMHVSSYLFDDEGTFGQDTVVIEKGILKSGLSDVLSASKLGLKLTGNGKRESFKRKAYARMTNTFFEGGSDNLADMIESIEHGFLIERASSGMEDPKDWGIQCMMESAREIVNGKLTDNYYAPIVMTGYVPDLLCSISMVSPDVEVEGSGYCGKGYKEYVKVSCGGAYLKAKARLG